MKIIYALLACILFFKCAGNQNKNESLIQDTLVRDISGIKGVSADPLIDYQNRLNELPKAEKSFLEGMKIFKEIFQSTSPEINDKALKIFLDYQNNLITSLNEKIASDQNLGDKLNTLFSGDTAKWNKDAINYQKEIQEYGLQLDCSEGMAYLTPNVSAVLSYFADLLSAPTLEYSKQLTIEINNYFADDGGLSISVEEVGKRLVFWDQFISKYPDHLFNKDAKEYYTTYLSTLLVGLDNTPAYDFESKVFSTEFVATYKSIVKNYPDTKSAGILKQYLKLLGENNYTWNKRIEKFTQNN